ncbi:hypothetical protein GOP47_0023128 [Adiantum capillus-veneris]|uniref:Transmembrane protein n=1 Tax=Adiantum capillus-veneris TaxID=13818 RepID=A0A9D4Z5Z7_ADICA|nr:hypothetical protein GOP47_0023128 [Adiantum capillus-veneris]
MLASFLTLTFKNDTSRIGLPNSRDFSIKPQAPPSPIQSSIPIEKLLKSSATLPLSRHPFLLRYIVLVLRLLTCLFYSSADKKQCGLQCGEKKLAVFVLFFTCLMIMIVWSRLRK